MSSCRATNAKPAAKMSLEELLADDERGALLTPAADARARDIWWATRLAEARQERDAERARADTMTELANSSAAVILGMLHAATGRFEEPHDAREQVVRTLWDRAEEAEDAASLMADELGWIVDAVRSAGVDGDTIEATRAVRAALVALAAERAASVRAEARLSAVRKAATLDDVRDAFTRHGLGEASMGHLLEVVRRAACTLADEQVVAERARAEQATRWECEAAFQQHRAETAEALLGRAAQVMHDEELDRDFGDPPTERVLEVRAILEAVGMEPERCSLGAVIGYSGTVSAIETLKADLAEVLEVTLKAERDKLVEALDAVVCSCNCTTPEAVETRAMCNRVLAEVAHSSAPAAKEEP